MADQFLFVQTQSTTLAGAGAVIGDTSIILSSFKTIDDTNLAMTDFGIIGYMTLEPNSGTQEEQISFSGITQNSNGTTTLTGVKTVLFVSPYTETSGLAKTHAGGTKAIVTNTAGFYNRLTGKNDDETITGLWTFPNDANTPQLGASYVAPTLDTQVASKKYVDTTAVSGAPNANTTTKGIVQEATVSQVNSGTSTGSTGAVLFASPADLASSIYGLQLPTSGQKSALVGNNTDIAVGSGNTYVTQTGLQHSAEQYGSSTTGNDTYVITLSPAPTSYTDGMVFRFKVDTANTGAASLNVNGLGTKTIKKWGVGGKQDLSTGDIPANSIPTVVYDGTDLLLFSAQQPRPLYNQGSAVRASGAGTGNLVVAHGLGVTPRLIVFTAIGVDGGAGNAYGHSTHGSATGTGQQSCTDSRTGASATPTPVQDTSNIVKWVDSATTTQVVGNLSALDATNFTINFTTYNVDTSGLNYTWEAFA